MIYYYTKKIRKTNNQRIVFALGSDIDQFYEFLSNWIGA